MKNLKLFLIGLATITIISCGGDKKIESSTESIQQRLQVPAQNQNQHQVEIMIQKED